MRFTFDRDAFIKEMAIAQEITSMKTIGSLLSSVLLEAREGAVTLKATDSRIMFLTKIPVEITEVGDTVLHCDRLMQILCNLPQGDNEFDRDEGGEDIIIRSKTFNKKYNMKSVIYESFPEFDDTTKMSFFELPSKDFIEMISHTKFSIVTNDESRFYMSGVSLLKEDDNIILVSSDGKRLSIDKRPIDIGSIEIPQIIIPVKMLNIIQKNASYEGNIKLCVTDRKLYVKFNNYEFSSTLINGAFPDYHKVVPQAQEQYFTVLKSDLKDALSSIKPMIFESPKFYMEIKEGSLCFTTPENEFGTAKVQVPIEYSGSGMKFAFSYKFMQDIVNHVDSETIKIEFTDSLKSITAKPVPEATYFYIVMPASL